MADTVVPNSLAILDENVSVLRKAKITSAPSSPADGYCVVNLLFFDFF